MNEFELEAGESITRSVRKHWFVQFVEVLPFFLLALLPLLIPDLIRFVVLSQPTGLESLISALTLSNPWMRLLLGLWWLIMWIAAFNIFTSHYLNQWIITTHRIIEINQHGFFNRQVSSLLLNRVQDVTTEIEGFFPTLIGYGTLVVQSAGAHDYFTMSGIPHPQELRDLIMREIAALHGHIDSPRA